MRSRLLAIVLALPLLGCQLIPTQPTQPTPTAPTRTPLSPTATAIPAAALLERGLELRRLGEYDRAAEQFYALIHEHAQDSSVAEASFYLAESFALRGRWGSAIAALTPIANAKPANAWSARALFLLARSYEQSNEPARASVAYAQYLDLKTPLAPYAQIHQADLLLQLSQPAKAAAAFEAAAESPIVLSQRTLAYEHAASAQLRAAQPTQAMRLYRILLTIAKQPTYRAQLLLEGAAAAEAAGNPEQQVAWLRTIIEELPTAPAAIDAIDQLLALDQPLDPTITATIYRRAERWDEARTQYAAAIAASNGEAQLALRRERALLLREGSTPDYASALAELADILGSAPPESELAHQIRLDQIQTLGQSGERRTAIAQYQAYAQAQPNDPYTPEALSRAMQLLEREQDTTAATAQRRELAQRYPTSTQGQAVLFPAGLALYQSGQLAEAAILWEQLANQSSLPNAAQGAYWAGRARRESGDHASGDSLLRRAIALAPESYYAMRAATLIGQPSQTGVPLTTQLTSADWAALSTWIEQWAAPISADTPAPTIAALLQEPAIRRAIDLGDVALWDEARSEWRAVIDRHGDDPRYLAIVAQIATQQQLVAVATAAADQLAQITPATTQPAPAIVARLRFATPYLEIVQSTARELQIDPLQFYALIRQESHYDPTVVSAAGARGLTQVMPETARGILQRLGISELQDADLSRPALNIRLGARYLSAQLQTFNQQLEAALAAYNAGPGNIARWQAAAGSNDPDSFVEAIDYAETRTYVKIVLTNYAAYRHLYAAN